MKLPKSILKIEKNLEKEKNLKIKRNPREG